MSLTPREWLLWDLLMPEWVGRPVRDSGPPRFVIFSSYGNDSVAMIQWAHEQRLEGVHVVYTDTGWAAKMWADRVDRLEQWVRTLGFTPHRTSSIGFRQLALDKKGFPTQQLQWCSYILKIQPGERWLSEQDPNRQAVCLVGVRRAESRDRAEFPRYSVSSNSHGGRVMIAPMADWTEDVRDIFIRRAGVEPLPHRSMECSPCVNSNRRDLRNLSDDDADKAQELETEVNERFGPTPSGKPRTFFRPKRHMGATGFREVLRWANSEHGKFKADESDDEDLGAAGCEAGWCGA